jgi:tetratricopeptide (TPR) repeat protein
MPGRNTRRKTPIEVVDVALGITSGLITLMTDWDKVLRAPGFVRVVIAGIVALCAWFIVARARANSTAAARRWLRPGIVGLILIIAVGWTALWFAVAPRRATIRVVVAEFVQPDGSDPFDVTEVVIARTREQLTRFGESIEVVELGRSFRRGDPVAFAKRAGAEMIVWGSYQSTPTHVRLELHYATVPKPGGPVLPTVSMTIPVRLPRDRFDTLQAQAAVAQVLSTIIPLVAGGVEASRGQPAKADIIFASVAASLSDCDLRGQVQALRGFVNTRMARWQTAVTLYSEAIACGFKSPELYVERGRAYVFLKNYDLALADLTRAIVAKPHHDGYMLRGEAYFNLKKWHEAEHDFTHAIASDPRNSLTRIRRAVAAAAQEHWRTADADLRALFAMTSSDASAASLIRERRTDVAKLRARIDEGITERDALIEKDTYLTHDDDEDIVALALTGRAARLIRFGEYDAAEADLRRALSLTRIDDTRDVAQALTTYARSEAHLNEPCSGIRED